MQSFLIVDDDLIFTQVLARSLSRRGYDVRVCHSAESVAKTVHNWAPDLVTLDLKMQGATGLTLIKPLVIQFPDVRILVLTGYASISTAVEAIKLGATHYLPKPANTDDILAALVDDHSDAQIDLAEKPLSVNRLEWEHIQKVLAEYQGNISATARALGMHRRTLQRKLAKHPVRK